MDENEKFQIIKKLVATNGNKQTAYLKIGIGSVSHKIL